MWEYATRDAEAREVIETGARAEGLVSDMPLGHKLGAVGVAYPQAEP